LSQKELARRLGLKEQQIQRYEARRYAGASLERVQAVADALGVQIHERVLLPTVTGVAPSAAKTAGE
ncbi:MAG: helix-turn-helix transcriptional regulator, partial [Chloroflexota bacterium]|nr:helix-turn-helix transcriptional regulator [Chloroflexota bacterium]